MCAESHISGRTVDIGNSRITAPPIPTQFRRVRRAKRAISGIPEWGLEY